MSNFIPIFSLFIWGLIFWYQGNSSGGHTYTEWQVDSKGNKIKKTELKRFDSQNNLIKWVQYLEDNHSLTDSFSYKFNEGLKTKEYRYSNGRLWTQKFFIYDKNKKVTETKTIDKNEKPESSTKHKFLDNLETILHYSELGELYSIDTITYGNKNKKISETQYLSEGDWFTRYKYDYDLKGNMIKEQTEVNPIFDGIGVVEYSYKYDTNNRQTKLTVTLPDKSKEYYIYEYTDK